MIRGVLSVFAAFYYVVASVTAAVKQNIFDNLNPPRMKQLYLLFILSLSFSFINAQTLQWAKVLNNSQPRGGNITGESIKTDAAGNIYIVGTFTGTADFDPGVDTQHLFSPINSQIFLAKYDAAGNYLFAKSIGGNENDRGQSLVLDASGNAYITGVFRITADFDPGVGTQNITSRGNDDIFIAKYDASGNYIYAKGIGGSGNDAGESIAVDGSGNVWITGSFWETVDFDPGVGTQNLISAGQRDIFIAKYDATGNYVNALKIGESDNDAGLSIAVDVIGNAYVTGYFRGTADFDPGPSTQNLTAAGFNDDIFIAKYTSAGSYVYAKNIGSSGSDRGKALAVDAAGNVYITGSFTNTADFDPGAGTQNLVSTSNTEDIFLAKYDPSGSYLYAVRMGGTNSESGETIAIDASGNAYITGIFSSAPADFDPGAGTQNLTSSGSTDIFFAKYDATGNYVYAKRIGGSVEDEGQSITIDGSGNTWLTGSFNGGVDFDPGPGLQPRGNPGNYSGFFGKYDNNGNYLLAKSFGGYTSAGSDDQSQDIAVDAAGNTYITGSFNATLDFDPGPGFFNLTSAGSADIFFAKYDVSGNVIFANRIGGTGSELSTAIAVDASGNIYITGYFAGIADFDPGTGSLNLTSAGSSDIFIAKYDATGNLVFANRIGEANFEVANDIAVDASGNIYLTGYFTGTVDFDPGTGIQNLTTAGFNDIFFAKYDASGGFIYAKNVGSSAADLAQSLAIDGSGNLYITGIFSGTADFDPGAGTQTLTTVGQQDIFLAKYNSSGNYVYAKSIGGKTADASNSIAVDNLGNALITGYFTDTVDFNPGPDVVNLVSATASRDIFFAKYDVSGNYVYAKKIGGKSNSDDGKSIATDATGNAYITGVFVDTVDFNPGADTLNLISDGLSDDIFIAKYDNAGNYVYAKRLGSRYIDYSRAIAVDGSGNAYITGQIFGTANFDSTILVPTNPIDIYLAKFSTSASLPIVLLDFKISTKDQTANLVWRTVHEQNGLYFDIEKSTNGIVFKPIGRVSAAGNSVIQEAYSFVDKELNTRSYYKLKLMDRDGKFTYSNTLSAEPKLIHQVLLYPNPVHDVLFLNIKAVANETINIAVINYLGIIVLNKTVSLSSGRNSISVDMQNLPPGAYLLKVSNKERSDNYKLIKE